MLLTEPNRRLAISAYLALGLAPVVYRRQRLRGAGRRPLGHAAWWLVKQLAIH